LPSTPPPGGRPEGRPEPLAILGGTFDPVHYGHLRLADDVRRALGVREVRLVPGGDPPHRDGPAASGRDRSAMLHLAVASHPGLVVDERELNRTGKSYTVLTLEELRAEHPVRPLWLLLGADAFRGLPSWHRWHELFDLAHIVVAERPGVDLRDELPPDLAAEWKKREIVDPAGLFSTPAGSIYVQHVSPQPISATGIRAQLAQGVNGNDELPQLLPAAVLTYIDQHRLYRPPPDAT
jgi:nicotinate-nucleotide adenylyltransferase